jgi:hypothetical protein
MFKHKKRGQSSLEFVALMVLLISAMIIFQKYMAQGVTGRLKGVGDSLGQGRIYDPNLTTACAFDIWFPSKDRWYEDKHFFNNCVPACLEVTKDLTPGGTCDACIGNSDPGNVCNL